MFAYDLVQNQDYFLVVNIFNEFKDRVFTCGDKYVFYHNNPESELVVFTSLENVKINRSGEYTLEASFALNVQNNPENVFRIKFPVKNKGITKNE